GDPVILADWVRRIAYQNALTFFDFE
ncbi:MAG: hypothetical protein ACI9W4_002304, partial [Rhodothermales bacterium]